MVGGMKGVGFKLINGELRLLTLISENIICQSCYEIDVCYMIYKDSKHHYQYCIYCIKHIYNESLTIDEVVKSEKYYKNFIDVLHYNFISLGEYNLFKIGEKGNLYDTDIEKASLALFNTTCERARSAIRTFCLYCIRYQKGRVNRDLRRKISELLWNDKIQWLE